MSIDGTDCHPTDFEDQIGPGRRTRDFDVVLEFFRSVCNQIENNNTEAGGEEYEQWMNDHRIDPDILTRLWEETDQCDCVRLSALSNYVNSHASSLGDSGDWIVEKYADEFNGQPLFEYCRSLCYNHSSHPKHRIKVFISGKKAIEGIRGNASLYIRTMIAGIAVVSGTQSLPIEYDEGSLNKEEILSECAKYGEKATLLRPEEFTYQKYATVLELQGRYDKAEKQLQQAIEIQLERGGSPRPLNERIDELNKNRQRYELEQSIEKADKQLTTIDNDLSRVETELDNVTDKYRNDFIQFIGFFAAILTIALTSVQMATSLPFPQSGGLILVLVGGITIAFGELKAIFSTSAISQDEGNWRPTIVGVLLIVLGLLVGVGVELLNLILSLS